MNPFNVRKAEAKTIKSTKPESAEMPRNGNAQTRRTQFEKSFQTFTIGIKEKVNYTVSKDLANFAVCE